MNIFQLTCGQRHIAECFILIVGFDRLDDEMWAICSPFATGNKTHLLFTNKLPIFICRHLYMYVVCFFLFFLKLSSEYPLVFLTKFCRTYIQHCIGIWRHQHKIFHPRKECLSNRSICTYSHAHLTVVV